MYGDSRRAAVEREQAGPWLLERFWSILDPFFQLIFGRYDPTATEARVPATDRVALLSQAERRKHGVFIPLDSDGSPTTPEAKLALLKQDRRARQKNRDPRTDYQVIWLPSFWRTRIHAFVFSALTMAATLLALGFFGPLIVGRAVLGMVTAAPLHDGYSYLAGMYVCLLAAAIGRRVGSRITRSAYAKRLRRSDSSIRFKRSILHGFSKVYATLLLYAVLPGLAGLNIEVYLSIPARYGITSAPPVIHVMDAW
jgi:E3 ubiquitin-protein ligase MARCH6